MIDASPCYKCTRDWKCAECHCFCKEWKEWEKEHNRRREDAQKAKDISRGIDEQREGFYRKVRAYWK